MDLCLAVVHGQFDTGYEPDAELLRSLSSAIDTTECVMVHERCIRQIRLRGEFNDSLR